MHSWSCKIEHCQMSKKLDGTSEYCESHTLLGPVLCADFTKGRERKAADNARKYVQLSEAEEERMREEDAIDTRNARLLGESV